MINTYNESSLHKTLKTFYSVQENALTEQKIGPYIADLLCPNGEIIEIQTKNVSKLKEKIDFFIKEGHKVKVVHPVTVKKTIETYGTDFRPVSKRKSPKKESVYTMLRELTGLTDCLLKKNFSLVILEIECLETRIKTKEPVQLINKSRRFKKDYIIKDKSLLTIGKASVFRTKKDYLSLLPPLPEVFSSRELSAALKKTKPAPSAWKSTSLILWLYSRAGIIERTTAPEGTKAGKTYYYRIK